MSNLIEIPPEIEILFERAKELRQELMVEYEIGIKDDKDVSLRAMCLTHEVLERIRVALDHSMTKYWNKNILNNLSEKDKKKRKYHYFPIRSNLNSFNNYLIKAKMEDLKLIDEPMYNFLLENQPFMKESNKWLYSLTELAGTGKHEEFVNQKQVKICIFKAESEWGSVSWIPQYLKFDLNDPKIDKKMIGAPIDPYFQTLISNPYKQIRHEISTDFRLEWEDLSREGSLSAPFFCSVVIDQAYRIVKKIMKLI